MVANILDLKRLSLRTAVVTLTALAIAALAFLLWQLLSVLLLIFGSALVAILLSSVGQWIAEKLGIPYGFGLTASLLLIGGVISGAGWLLATQVAGQFDQLSAIVPNSWREVSSYLQDRMWGRAAMEELKALSIGSLAGSVAFTTIGAIGNALLIVVGGLYLAGQPGLYRRGLLALFPEPSKARAERALDESQLALTQWLKAQFLSMLVVGGVTAAGLWLLGMPTAIALGVIAGLAEFVPYVGPIAAAVPALLVALSEGGSMVFWVAGLYLLVQQIESNLVMPLFTRKLVYLPPALTIFSIVAFALLFGPLGALFAAPLTVFVYVLIGTVYVEGILHRRVELPSE